VKLLLKKWPEYYILLLLMTFGVNILGYAFILVTKIDLKYTDIVSLSIIFAIVNLISIHIFQKGQNKEPDNQVIYTLVSIGLRFFLDLVIALGWFIVAKKIVLSSVLLFFILYLTFTLFSFRVIFNILKNKSL
jgi:hypothetical protein